MKMNIANFFQKNQLIAKVEKAQKCKRSSLNLEDFDLTEFPDVVLNCDNLRCLILQRNQISELPKEVGTHLSGLKYLSLQFNNLESFPDCLKHLTGLVSLNISHNPIKYLVNEINCFKDLKYLWCNSCGITCLPTNLGYLNKLETFGARNNDIIGLPMSITNLKGLRWLSLEGNSIYSLPNDFYKLNNLHHLNLNRNCFVDIPEVLSKMGALLYLHLQRNNIKILDRDLIIAFSHVRISLLNNPLENGQEFTEFKHLMLNPADYKPENANSQEIVTDSSDWDSDWANSTDTMYLNYDSFTPSSDSEEVVINARELSRFFAGH